MQINTELSHATFLDSNFSQSSLLSNSKQQYPFFLFLSSLDIHRNLLIRVSSCTRCFPLRQSTDQFQILNSSVSYNQIMLFMHYFFLLSIHLGWINPSFATNIYKYVFQSIPFQDICFHINHITTHSRKASGNWWKCQHLEEERESISQA